MKAIMPVYFSIVCLFTSCKSSESNHDNLKQGNSQISWTVLASGTQCNQDVPMQKIIKTQEEYKSLWLKSHQSTDMDSVGPAVDFDKKWVAAIYLGMVNSGGHSAEIKSIETIDDNTVISVLHKKPGAGCMSAAVIEFPFLLVTIDRLSNDKVSFQLADEEVPCK